MNALTPICVTSPDGSDRAVPSRTGIATRSRSRRRFLRRSPRFFENGAITVVFMAMIALPLGETVFRTLFRSSIPQSAALVQHLTLWIGMLGGMVAARDRRLLALSTTQWLHGRWAARARWFAATVAGTVSALLALAAVEFVLAEREAGQMFLARIPLWTVQAVLPAGFAVIAARLWLHAGNSWKGRTTGTAVSIAFVALVSAKLILPSQLLWPAISLLLAGAVLGVPIFAVIGGAGLVLFWREGLPIAAMPVEHYRLTTNPALPSIPLFTLAGYLMAEGGAAARLLRVFQALFGWLKGGPALAVVMICAFFTAFTGGSGVTILALGGVMMPILLGAQFSRRNALGLVTGAGSLGILLPPCLPVILYAIIARTDIKQMFLAGFVPGMLLIALTAAWGLWVGRKTTTSRQAFAARETVRAVAAAKWELLLPVISLVALFSGWATPVEAAAITAGYAFVVEVFILRDLRLWRDIPRIATEAGLLVGGILLILGVALGLTNYVIDAQIPDQLATWAETHVQSRWLFLLGLNLLLIAIGGFVEIYAAIVVAAPLLAPIGARLGIDPVHLGIIFLANLELGFLAPPVGLNLLLSSSRLRAPVSEVTRAVLPLLAVMFLGVLLITYWPPLTTALPRWLSPP